MTGRLHYFIIILFMTLSGIVRPAASCAADTTHQEVIDTLLRQLADDPENVKLLTRLSAQYIWKGDLVHSKEIGQHLLRIGQRGGIESTTATLNGHIILGQISAESSDPLEAFQHLETARGIAEHIGDHRALMSIYSGLGGYALNSRNDAYSSLDYYFKALEESRALNSTLSIAIHLSDIAECYRIRNDPAGLQFALQANDYASRTDNATVRMFTAMNLADQYLMIGETEEAKALIDQAWDYYEKSGYNNPADLLVLTARHQAQTGELKVALGLIHQAVPYLENSTNATVNRIWLLHAQILRMMGKNDEAIDALKSGLQHVADKSAEIHIGDFYKEIAECYAETGKPTEALEYMHRYIEHQDSAMRIDRERTLQEQRIKHEIYENERRIDEQRIELLSWRNRTIIIVSILIVAIVTMTLLYLSYRKKNRLYRAIVAQNRNYINRERMLREQLEAATNSSQQNTEEPATTPDSAKNDDLIKLFFRAHDGAQDFYRSRHNNQPGG